MVQCGTAMIAGYFYATMTVKMTVFFCVHVTSSTTNLLCTNFIVHVVIMCDIYYIVYTKVRHTTVASSIISVSG